MHDADAMRLLRITFGLMTLVCSVAALGQRSVADAQKHLLSLTATNMETEVAPPIQDAIATLKQALAETTDAVMTAAPAQASVAILQQRLSGALPAERVGTRTDAEWTALGNRNDNTPMDGMYGGGLHLAVTSPRPGLVLVEERFDIECGADTLLLVYGNEAGHWKRMLRWDSGKYAQVSGAFGDTYETRILKPTRNGHPLLLVLHGTPWCTSTMSSFAMDVFDLGIPGNKPMWHGAHGYRRADLEPPLTLKTTADGFEVRTSVSVFGDAIARKGIMRYAVTTDAIHRVQPLASNALGMLEEWLEMPREEASEFADDAAGSLTWKLYDTLTWRDVASAQIDTHWTANYGPVRACNDSARHFQAEMATSRGYGAKEERGTTYYVQMKEVPNGYRIHAVTLKPDATCTGPNLMARP